MIRDPKTNSAHDASSDDGVASVVEARRRKVGGLGIRRLLPARGLRMVGPFIFLDHMGPETFSPGRGVDVVPHPHINLATLTYLFDGELVHRDSLGTVETISPGDINWMHAGSGIVHSERTAPGHRNSEGRIEGLQFWAALPEAEEETTPFFRHYPGTDLPQWSGPGVSARILVGDSLDRHSPVVTVSRTLLVDVSLEPGARFPIPVAEERAAYIAAGRVSVDGRTFGPSEMIVFNSRSQLILTAEDRARVIILGGDAIDKERYIWWNFVSSSAERIERARRDWREHRFPPVPGEGSDRAEMPVR